MCPSKRLPNRRSCIQRAGNSGRCGRKWNNTYPIPFLTDESKGESMHVWYPSRKNDRPFASRFVLKGRRGEVPMPTCERVDDKQGEEHIVREQHKLTLP